MSKPPSEHDELPTRNGYGYGLVELGREREDVVALDADLAGSTRGAWFKDENPDRWFNMGIAEQDMMVTAAGMASTGKTAFASTFAIFTERGFEQVRNQIARNDLNVTVAGSHAGLITGQDGESAQAIEDVSIYRTLPNMKVISPGDAVEAEKYVEKIADDDSPVYFRLIREDVPVVFDDDHDPEIGEGTVMRDGDDVTVIAHGAMLHEAIEAGEKLADEGIDARVINMPSIKPLDDDLVVEAAEETQGIVTAEDHSVIGGLGSAVAETVTERCPVPIRRVGVDDTFGESGLPDELYEAYGLTAEDIVESAKELL
ncbi:MAG: transketolase family protein [Halobacteria archaeon]|nr:transketolase family protein [Halobacteria archaeon]